MNSLNQLELPSPRAVEPPEDLLDPERYAEHLRRRARAAGLAAASGLGVATTLFWAIAYLTELELELPAVAAIAVGAVTAVAVWWTLAPKRLSVDADAPELDDADLEAIARDFVAPRDDAEPTSTGTVSEQELAQVARDARSTQRADALRIWLAVAATLGTLLAVLYGLGFRAGHGMQALPHAVIAAAAVGFLVARGLAPKLRTMAEGVGQLARELTSTATLDVVRERDVVASFASQLGISVAPRQRIRADGAPIAAAGPAPVEGLARLGKLLPWVTRTDLAIDQGGHPELLARGGWRLAPPWLGDRVTVTEPSGRTLGRVERPFGRLRYRLVADQTITLDRDGLGLRFRARGPGGDEVGELDVFRPSLFARWFLGPFAGERGVRVHFGPSLDVDQRRLLLVAAVHLARSI
ncbi:MAG: hypothetical protein H6719_06685 [Sandaracinaceae bacterium]|nr:hypothetical protein [Sandaracinaceae bacterium]